MHCSQQAVKTQDTSLPRFTNKAPQKNSFNQEHDRTKSQIAAIFPHAAKGHIVRTPRRQRHRAWYLLGNSENKIPEGLRHTSHQARSTRCDMRLLEWPFSLYRRGNIAYRKVEDVGSQALTTPTSLNKAFRPFCLGDNSIWSFPSVSSLSDYSVWRSWKLS